MRLLRSFQARVVLLVLTVALAATALAVLVSRHYAEMAVWEQAGADAELVALTISKSLQLSSELPEAFERSLEQDMLATAQMLAEYVALGERYRVPREKMLEAIERAIPESSVSEIWITDAKGRVVYSVPRDVSFTFSPDPKVQPQASAFWALLTGQATRVTQPLHSRDLDGKSFKYVGVAGVDGPRIIQVGSQHEFVMNMRNRFSVSRVGEELLRKHVLIRPLIVLDAHLQPLGEQTESASGEPDAGSGSPKSGLNTEQVSLAQQALESGAMIKAMEPDAAVVYMPFRLDPDKGHGVFVAAFSREDLDRIMRDQQILMVTLGLATVVAASVVGWLVSLPLTQRLVRITAAARGIERGDFGRLAQLTPDLSRRDEIGVLGRAVHTMGQEVRNRQTLLEQEVSQRTRELAERNQALATAQAIITQELDLARQLQLGILPAAFPTLAGWKGAARIRMQQQMGGDFFDFIERPDGTLALVMADVSGKGISAAFFMAMVRTSLLHHLGRGETPARSLAAANEELCCANPLNLFVTAFVAVLHPVTGELEMSNAGHNPPLHRMVDGQVKRCDGPGDLALGVMPGYVYATDHGVLAPGEYLVTYTDGVTEAFNTAGDAFGMERLIRWLAARPSFEAPEYMVEGLFDEVRRFEADAPQADDTTVAVVFREPSLA